MIKSFPSSFRASWRSSDRYIVHSCYVLVPFTSSLSTNALIGCIPQDSLICWLLILFTFVLQLFSLVLSSHLLPTFVLFFYVSALFPSAYVIIGCNIVLFILYPFSYTSIRFSNPHLINYQNHRNDK